MAKRHPRNLYFDIWSAAYEAKYQMPYQSIVADFVGLDGITNKGPLAPRMTIEVFQRGVANYLMSEVSGGHTLKHLCSKFVFYWRAPANKYGRHVERGRGMVQAGSEAYGNGSWVMRFLRKVNEAKLPEEKREQLWALMDAVEGEQITEQDALRRLAAIRDAPIQQRRPTRG